MSCGITIELSPSKIEINLNTVVTRDIVFDQAKHSGNGVLTTFATPSKFKSNAALVFVNGVLAERGAGKAYIEGADQQSVVFATAPAGGSSPDEILIFYAIL